MTTDEQERAAFEAFLSTFPKPMQATIRDSMSRSESNSWTFFKAGRASLRSELAAAPAVAWLAPSGSLLPADSVLAKPWMDTPLIVRPSIDTAPGGRE